MSETAGHPGEPGEVGQAAPPLGTGTGGSGGAGGEGGTGERGPVGPAGPKGHLSSNTWLILVVACLVVAGIGVQALLSQRADERKTDCINEWATSLVDTIRLRADGNADLRAATARKNAADDAVTNVFVEAFISKPRPSDDVLEEHFTAALTEFAAARQNLQIVSGTVENQQARNPYPSLDLECDPEDS